jgi:hypothetical protein
MPSFVKNSFNISGKYLEDMLLNFIHFYLLLYMCDLNCSSHLTTNLFFIVSILAEPVPYHTVAFTVFFYWISFSCSRMQV